MDPAQPTYSPPANAPAPSSPTFPIHAPDTKCHCCVPPRGHMQKLFLAALFAAILLIFWTWLNSPLIVSVAGTGEASVPATTATISCTLTNLDSTPTSAMQGVIAKTAGVKQMLKASGIAEDKIRESQVTVVPAGAVTSGAVGYQAVLSMTVETAQIDGIQALIAGLYAQGAYIVSQPVLGVANPGQIQKEALNEALRDAQSKADVLASKSFKFFKKRIAIAQQVSQSTTTTTSTQTSNSATLTNQVPVSNVFKVVQAVAVSYKMW